MTRNVLVEEAVTLALASIDRFIAGSRLKGLPQAQVRRALDSQLEKRGSVRLASLFLAFYGVVDGGWDCNSIPTGLRGQHGDKKLATELSQRHLTLHGAITAFGENLGWKGNVEGARLQGDPRFDDFSRMLADLDAEGRVLASDYLAAKFADSRQVIAPLPPVGEEVLTYARARQLFQSLISVPSEGNIQQFLVAALLQVHRARYGLTIKTHHVHASDKFDSTAGDIEEFRENTLLRAYEVTVRPDWKNRVTDFRKKMDAFGLTKYAIIASGVMSDDDLREPAAMIRFLEPYGRDLAVVDIHEFVDVFAMELSAEELRQVITRIYSFLTEPRLCGRADIIEAFSAAVEGWLDRVAA